MAWKSLSFNDSTVVFGFCLFAKIGGVSTAGESLVPSALRFSTRSRHPISNGTDKPAEEESMASGPDTSDTTISFGHPVVIPSFTQSQKRF